MRENRKNLLPTTKSPALHWSNFELRDDSKVWNGGQPARSRRGALACFRSSTNKSPLGSGPLLVVAETGPEAAGL